jgi:hypothetical protein
MIFLIPRRSPIRLCGTYKLMLLILIATTPLWDFDVFNHKTLAIYSLFLVHLFAVEKYLCDMLATIDISTYLKIHC